MPSEPLIPVAIPATAWEQGVFVVLFIVLVAVILGWVARENSLSRAFQKTEAAAREKAQTERDDQWRAFLEQQRQIDQENGLVVRKSLDGLTTIIASLVDEVHDGRTDFREHDAMERAKLEEMSKVVHDRQATRPRGKVKEPNA
jgi:hypothetical protein